MPPVYLLRCGVLAATSLLCLSLLTACENTAAPDQLTVVEGTVTSTSNGRPLPGVLLAVESFSRGFYGPMNFTLTGDSARTDAQGKYTLHFYNKKGLYYTASFEPYVPNKYFVHSRYAFFTNNASTGTGADKRELTLGRTNTFDFKPDELRAMSVRIRNRNTRYQRLEWEYSYLHGTTLDTTAYLHDVFLSPSGSKARYLKYTPAGVFVKDTAVSMVILNPASLFPDTVRATLTFIR